MKTAAHDAPTQEKTTMQAIVQDRYGEAGDVLRLEETGRPAIGDGEVLLRVHAAGVDRGVWHLMTGLPYPVRLAGYGVRAPKTRIRGREVAGRVEAIGKDVTSFQVGDEVFGIAEGAFAEYACAQPGKLARRPESLTAVQAAAVPVSALTALQAVRDHGHVHAGQKVLVIGASGGVGTFAVQIAKAYGAEVTGVCSTAKMDLVRSIGADHVIDYTRAGIADGAQRYDVIIDIGGNRPLRQLRARPYPPRDAGHRRGRDRRPVARRIRSQPAGTRAVAVRPAAAGRGHRLGERSRPARARPAHRVRPGDAGHRQDVPAEPGTRRHPVHAARPRPREGRHHRLRR